MTSTAGALVCAVGVLGAVAWLALARQWPRAVHAIVRPLVLVVLVVLAVVLDARVPEQRPWVVLALLLFLTAEASQVARTPLAPSRPRALDRWFVVGTLAALLGHLAYVVSFLVYGVTARNLAVGALVVVVFTLGTVQAVLGGARTRGGAGVATGVAVYGLAVAAMAVTGFGTGEELTALGAVAFLGSDLLRSWSRFVRELRGAPVLGLASYHLAQTLLVVGLVR